MGLTFDFSASVSNSAYDNAHRRRSTLSALPPPKSRSSQSTFISKLAQRIRPFSNSSRSTLLASSKPAMPPSAAVDSIFFLFPLFLREKIYGYVIGHHETLHILMKHKMSTPQYKLAYRRCYADGNLEDCVLKRCWNFKLRKAYILVRLMELVGCCWLVETCKSCQGYCYQLLVAFCD